MRDHSICEVTTLNAPQSAAQPSIEQQQGRDKSNRGCRDGEPDRTRVEYRKQHLSQNEVDHNRQQTDIHGSFGIG